MERNNLFTHTLSRSDIRKKSSFRIENLTYDDRLNLITLKKKLTEKVFRDLSKKYLKLIQDRKFDLFSISCEFEKEMGRSYDFKNPNYTIFFRKIEKIFLNKINLYNEKNAFNDCKNIPDNKKTFDIFCISIKYDKTKNFCYGKGFSNKNLNFFQRENNKEAFVKSQIEHMYSPIKVNINKKEKDEFVKALELNRTEKSEAKEIHPEKIITNKKKEYAKKLLDDIREKGILRKNSFNIKVNKNELEASIKYSKEKGNEELEKVQNLRRKWLEDKIAALKED